MPRIGKVLKKKPTREEPAAKSPVVLSCVNLKGGVGKTAIAVNFAAYAGDQGLKTLLIDLDPQTNATFCCISVDEWQEHAREKGTVANLLDAKRHTSAEGRDKSAKSVIRRRVFKNVDLIPSHLDLFTVDLDLAAKPARETKLRRAMKGVLANYDLVVCDCPPNLTIPTQNALALSTHYVIPVSPDFLSATGVALLMERIDMLGEDLELELEHAGIVISRVGRPGKHREGIIEALNQTFGDLIYPDWIKERVAVSEAAEAKKTVFAMKDPKATEEFSAVANELLKRMGLVA